MTLPLRNDLDEAPHNWLRRFGTTCGKCWNLVLSDPDQSAWCNVVVLVQEEGLWLTVLYRLSLPECSHEKGLLPSA